MPRVAGVTTAVPPHKVDQAEARAFARNLFSSQNKDIERLLPVFDNAGIDSRYFSRPIDWFATPHPLQEKNDIYIESATVLGEVVIHRLLEETRTAVDQIDYIIYVNTTGLATPSIDARLINRLGLRRDIRRTPIWGLGCAGGAAGLAHAYHHARGHPEQRILLVAVELCGLTFTGDDMSKSNLVATALFGEGAAAVLICGDAVEAGGMEMLDSCSRFYPDSLDIMGWNVTNTGLQVVLAQRIPDIVAEHARADLGAFLERHELGFDDIAQFLFHPGGAKVVAAYEQALQLGPDRLDLCRSVLRDYGNMSSVTVLFVLDRCFREGRLGSDRYGLVSALGPGFCSESLLLRG